MGKNVLIFSDGTGQIGGVAFDEDRTNIYKLYRATRVCPDSCIDPNHQVAFYDPGLGSQVDRGHLTGRFARWVYNKVSQVTGFGITANIIDCYAAIIRMWSPGDRIFLFGFSRGAYTIRCLAAVIANCGIPTQDKGGEKLKFDVGSIHKLASYAVKHVYQFTSSRPIEETNARQRFLLQTRDRLAERFRNDYGSNDPNDPTLANVYPYFVGVFDTVAALGSLWKTLLLFGIYTIAATAVSYLASLLPLVLSGPFITEHAVFFSFLYVFLTLIALPLALAVAIFLYTHVKFDFAVPNYPLSKRIATIHLTAIWQTFYDYTLNDRVMYAKHAISIDENRKDFARVPWGKKDSGRPDRNPDGTIWFEQVWFPGNHADIGGGYPENELRLSDGALRWMLACASTIPNGIRYDKDVLHLYPGPSSIQHDECKAGFGLLTSLFRIRWTEKPRALPGDKPPYRAILHRSVYERFDAPEVLHYDQYQPYKPKTLEGHVDFENVYKSGGPRNPNPTCVAEFVEARLR